MVASAVVWSAVARAPGVTGRTADTPGDRRSDLGVAEVDGRGLHSRLVRLHRRQRLPVGRLGVVVVLAADGVDLHQVGVALGLQPHGRQVGLSVGQRPLRLIECSLIRRWVDLVEHLAGADVGAFHEQARLDQAIHLRTYVGGERRRGAARQLGGARYGLGLQRHHAHLRRPRWRRRRLPGAAADHGRDCAHRAAPRQAPERRESRHVEEEAERPRSSLKLNVHSHRAAWYSHSRFYVKSVAGRRVWRNRA